MNSKPDNIFKVIRIYSRLSQEKLAIKLGWSKSYICEIETGSKNITMNIIKTYSQFMNIKPSQLLALNEQNFEENNEFSQKSLTEISKFSKSYLKEFK